jgi:hypothetical protein
MRLLRNVLISAVLVLTAGISAAFGQIPTPRVIYFNVNVPYTFTKVHYTLPAGKYILRQMTERRRDLFALYQGDMTHPPIAIVTTAPIYHNGNNFNEPTRMYYGDNEETEDAHPIFQGWSMAGDNGFEIVSIVPSRESRAQVRSR